MNKSVCKIEAALSSALSIASMKEKRARVTIYVLERILLQHLLSPSISKSTEKSQGVYCIMQNLWAIPLDNFKFESGSLLYHN